MSGNFFVRIISVLPCATLISFFIAGYDSLNIPTMVLACKSDLEKRISPSDALSTIQKYAGLVEISSQTDSGKKKMRRSLDLFIKMLEKVKSKCMS